MTKNHSHTFTSAFRKFLKTENLDVKYREKLLIESWETIMGKPIASRTTNIFLKNKILHVTFSSAPMKQEMMNNKPRVLEMISEDFGDLVDDIRFF